MGDEKQPEVEPARYTSPVYEPSVRRVDQHGRVIAPFVPSPAVEPEVAPVIPKQGRVANTLPPDPGAPAESGLGSKGAGPFSKKKPETVARAKRPPAKKAAPKKVEKKVKGKGKVPARGKR